MRSEFLAATLMATVALSACASSNTTVVTPVRIAQGVTYPTVRIEAGADAASVKQSGRNTFERELKDFLFTAGSGFTPGDALTIRYRFVAYDEGDQFQRWMASGLAGKGELKVEAVFLDTDQRELGKITVDGSISAGVLGGDFNDVIGKAAKNLADYTIKTF